MSEVEDAFAALLEDIDSEPYKHQAAFDKTVGDLLREDTP